jgi:phosphate starvation-inducible PhoH-like protein
MTTLPPNGTPASASDGASGIQSETLNFENARAAQALYVSDPQNLRRLEDRFHVKVATRDGWIKIDGLPEAVVKARDVFQQLHLAREKGLHIRKAEFNFAMDSVAQGSAVKLPDLQASRIQISAKKPPIAPKTLQQKNYVESIKTHDLIFGVGPAGTGKTFLAMAMAVAALKNEEVTRIVLTRPAVEAGEALGFLPGDLQEKIFPYLRPLYDALNDMLETEEIQRYMDKGIIEIAPLAYMRGRTLSRSFIILDEGQNTTTEQMFMFLTRLGQDSKCVVTGDPSQVDLPHSRKSGLTEAVQALHGAEGIAFTRFDEVDVIRHELVQRIIRAYKSHRGEKVTSMTL